ncbi:MAG TPA: CBS domain-containing protein [Nitrososphaeraceae archaeon]|nr:CBS domain-containing protein [Nitrososphaeraceae archaeon]
MSVCVRDLMRKNVITIRESDSIQDTARLMSDKKISALLITDINDNPVGLVTERDLARKVCVNDIQPSRVTNKEVMSSPLISIDSKSSPTTAIDLMLKNNVRHLLVVDDDLSNSRKQLGIITPLDLMRYEDYPREKEHADVIEMILEYYV